MPSAAQIGVCSSAESLRSASHGYLEPCAWKSAGLIGGLRFRSFGLLPQLNEIAVLLDGGGCHVSNITIAHAA
jgi:hypothetical protein